MLNEKAVYYCKVCGKEKHVDARAALSDRTMFCCGVAMIKRSNGMIRKNVR